MSFRFLFVGSAAAVIASLGAATSAIALPIQGVEQHTLIAQEVDLPEGQTMVMGRVASVDPDGGSIRVDLGDGSFDTIYLGTAEISRLGIDTGEDISLIYEGDDAVAIYRDDEMVTLSSGVVDSETSPTMTDESMTVTEEETLTQTTITEETTVSEPEVTTEEPEMEPQVTQQPTTTAEPEPEPVQGLW